MPNAAWIEAIERWRSLPLEERRRRRLEAIPRHVANSMAMEGEPMDEEWIRERLAPAYSASRYVETSFGILSCREIVPLLAERVGEVKVTISMMEFL